MRKPENAPPEARPLARPRSLVPGPSPKRERGAALDWHPLREAFARRRDAGAEPALWWRDDDAGADNPALRRLIALARESGCPVAVAAIPRRTDPSLKPLLRESGVAALVHGLAHENHAPPDAKKAEFGPHRPLGTLVAEAQSALSEARAALGETLLPVFVPPWNRMAPRLAARLPALGYVGLSAWGDGPETAGLLRADTHIDPVDWHGGRSLFAPKTLIARAAAALDRRANDPCAPLGLLTHHLVHDEAIWGFCAALFEEWRRLSGRFVLAKDLFCVGQPDRRGAVGR